LETQPLVPRSKLRGIYNLLIETLLGKISSRKLKNDFYGKAILNQTVVIKQNRKKERGLL